MQLKYENEFATLSQIFRPYCSLHGYFELNQLHNILIAINYYFKNATKRVELFALFSL